MGRTHFHLLICDDWNLPGPVRGMEGLSPNASPYIFCGHVRKLTFFIQWRKPSEVTFFELERAQIDRYEQNFVEDVSSNRFLRFWNWINS